MLLVIDAGNTNIVFAVHDGREIRAEWRAVTETTRTADEYAVLLAPLFSLQSLSFSDIDSAIIASVVPAALFDIRSFCRRYIHCEPLVVGDTDLFDGRAAGLVRWPSVTHLGDVLAVA